MSNIAWPIEQDAVVAKLLEREGVGAIEVAPTKVWPDPRKASGDEIDAYRTFWQSRGFSIVAAQALLFGQPQLTLFSDATTRGQTIDYLRVVIEVCARLGAQALVFGSPKNRRVGDLADDVAQPIAVDFFGQLAEVAARCETTVVLEANPETYGADFVTGAEQAIALVRAVDHIGLRLHLDSACMTLNSDPIESVFRDGADLVHHYHVSEPQLAPIGEGDVDHARFADSLKGIDYQRWCSIEMRMVEPFDPGNLQRAIETTKGWYSQ